MRKRSRKTLRMRGGVVLTKAPSEIEESEYGPNPGESIQHFTERLFQPKRNEIIRTGRPLLASESINTILNRWIAAITQAGYEISLIDKDVLSDIVTRTVNALHDQALNEAKELRQLELQFTDIPNPKPILPPSEKMTTVVKTRNAPIPVVTKRQPPAPKPPPPALGQPTPIGQPASIGQPARIGQATPTTPQKKRIVHPASPPPPPPMPPIVIEIKQQPQPRPKAKAKRKLVTLKPLTQQEPTPQSRRQTKRLEEQERDRLIRTYLDTVEHYTIPDAYMIWEGKKLMEKAAKAKAARRKQ